MKLYISNGNIPGTILNRAAMGNLTGKAFLKQVFYVSEGIMLTQIRNIAGIDGSTLQNWTKRGWVPNSHSKKYNIEQVSHILLINMLRACIHLEHIAWLLHYINGSVEDRSDDIISDSDLYDTICRILDELDGEELCTDDVIDNTIRHCTADYREPVPGAYNRLCTALNIIIHSHCASQIRHESDRRVRELMGSVETGEENDSPIAKDFQ